MNERRHCDRCGGPIRYDESEPSPGWLHIDQSDDRTCPLGDQFLLIRPIPTRDSLAEFFADRRNDDLPHPFRTGVEPRDFDLADALLKAFWPGVAVSDSQETPTP